MARSLDQILAELQPGYSGSENIIKVQQQSLQPAAEAEEAGLRAQLTQANDGILANARQRGLGFAGIPVAEQAKFAATEFAPALARVKSNQIQQSTGLAESLNQLNRDKLTAAQGIYQQDLNRDEQQRQFNEQLRAQREAEERQATAARAASGAGMSLGIGGRAAAPQQAASAAPSLQSFLSAKYQAAPTANRATQDSWVREYALKTGGDGKDSRLWAAYNQMYPWEAFNDQAMAKLRNQSVPTSNFGLIQGLKVR